MNEKETKREALASEFGQKELTADLEKEKELRGFVQRREVKENINRGERDN